jgi:endonuclease YncB( thermonuclease family)
LKSYGILIVAGVVGTLSGIGSTIDFAGWKASAAPRYDATISSCHAIDGDTLRCGEERIRLVGIDAPELPGIAVRKDVRRAIRMQRPADYRTWCAQPYRSSVRSG